MIYLGSDHRGFQLKEYVKKLLIELGCEFEDLGALGYDIGDDYPDIAKTVAQKLSEDLEKNKGILICGSGHGVDIAANKFKGVRAALCFNREVAAQSREHEDANVLVLPSDHLEESAAKDIVWIWLDKQFDGAERNKRRLGKILKLESENFR